MTTYILRRLLLMIPTLIGVTAVVFFVMALAPGGFGGNVINEAGAQKEGEEARRIREYFARRYGLDRPVYEQYFRWLNQVSPLGFRTSASVTFTADDAAQVQQWLGDQPLIAALQQPRVAGRVALGLAADGDQPAAAGAEQLLKVLTDGEAGIALVQRLMARAERDADRELFAQVRAADASTAAALLLTRLDQELAVHDRVLWGMPICKWPNFGQSLRGRPVLEMLGETVPVTILLNAITIPIIYLIGLGTGVLAAWQRGKLFDITSGFVLLALWSVPSMFVGVLMIGYLANNQYLNWFPTGGLHDLQADSMAFLPRWTDAGFQRGWLLDMVWHLVLPVVCMTYGGFAVLAKLTRASVLENISADHVRTARAKGLDGQTVMVRHVLRNSLLPLIAVFANLLPALFVGSVVIENIFSIQGMGKLGVEAAFMKDREIIMGTTLIGGLLGLLSELVRDLAYAAADPRVTYE